MSFLQRIGYQIFGLVGKLVDDFIGRALVLQKVWSHHFLVDDGGSVVRDRQHAPDEQHTLLSKKSNSKAKTTISTEESTANWYMTAYLEQKVERDDRGQHTSEELKHREDGVQHPVGQPFGVILLLAGLDGLHRHIGWIYDANHIA